VRCKADTAVLKAQIRQGSEVLSVEGRLGIASIHPVPGTKTSPKEYQPVRIPEKDTMANVMSESCIFLAISLSSLLVVVEYQCLM
jgi:hypothetical protein